jgi:hypothetical protein
MRRAAIVIIAVALASCSAPPKEQSAAGSAADRIQAIPPADPAKYRAAIKGWQNPYLIIRTDGVGLLDLSNNEEHIVKPEQVTDVLAKLPASAWPYGRVVAVQENSVSSEPDRVLIRRNRAIVAGTLEGLHVLINWVPSS